MHIAKIHVRFYEENQFIHGERLLKFMLADGSFTQYKRAWWPCVPVQMDGDRGVVKGKSQFIIITAIDTSNAGMEMGEMDADLRNGVRGALDLEEIAAYASLVRRGDTATFIALFSKNGSRYAFDGEIKSVLLHPKKRE